MPYRSHIYIFIYIYVALELEHKKYFIKYRCMVNYIQNIYTCIT